MTRYLIAFNLIIILVTGCDRHYDPTLVRINDLADKDPQKAILCLDSIDSRSLSSADRHFYDFLTIKAADKAYHKHTDDSLVLDVIEYMTHNADKSLRAEALYYGGRVYSDMGDYPRAIQYFQNALGCLPSNASLDLRANMLSQTGRLLNHLRLNDEAASYLEKVVAIDKQLRNTVNLVHDLQLLGHINLNASNIAIAEKCFKEALGYCHDLSPDHEAKTKMYIAETKRRTGRIDSALIYTRNILNDVKPATRNLALSYMTDIYKDADMLDSAYFYAKQLVESDDDLNKQFGYYILLAPEVRPYSTTEEINLYIDKYRYVVESMFDDNQNRLALEQIAGYNYDRQQRELVKAKQTKRILIFIIIGILIIATISIILNYLQSRRYKSAIQLLNLTNENLQKAKTEIINCHNAMQNTARLNNDNKEHDQRADLQNRLLLLYEVHKNDEVTIPDCLTQSEAYHLLETYIEKKKPLNEDDPLWTQLEKVIDQNYPSFKSSLQRLIGGKISSADFHTAILVKFGIRTTDMTFLLSRDKRTILSRRESLSKKMFDQKYSVNFADTIIRLL